MRGATPSVNLHAQIAYHRAFEAALWAMRAGPSTGASRPKMKPCSRSGVTTNKSKSVTMMDVTAAQQDQQRAVNEAETYANKVVPEAEGGAARIVAEANAYREQTILEAKGQTARYNQIHEQYQKAPAVTRERMYLETMERVLGPMDKTIVEFELRQRTGAPYRA